MRPLGPGSRLPCQQRWKGICVCSHALLTSPCTDQATHALHGTRPQGGQWAGRVELNISETTPSRPGN